MNKTKTYYQPCRYSDDGTNIEYGNIPEELYSFQAFETEEDCKNWLENNGYNPSEYAIIAYHDDDIEGVTLINEYGDVIEINDDNQNTDKAIFQFNSSKYYESATTLSRRTCEYLANIDEENVTKFNLDFDTSLQELLNDNMLDTTNCYFRVFI